MSALVLDARWSRHGGLLWQTPGGKVAHIWHGHNQWEKHIGPMKLCTSGSCYSIMVDCENWRICEVNQGVVSKSSLPGFLHRAQILLQCVWCMQFGQEIAVAKRPGRPDASQLDATICNIRAKRLKHLIFLVIIFSCESLVIINSHKHDFENGSIWQFEPQRLKQHWFRILCFLCAWLVHRCQEQYAGQLELAKIFPWNLIFGKGKWKFNGCSICHWGKPPFQQCWRRPLRAWPLIKFVTFLSVDRNIFLSCNTTTCSNWYTRLQVDTIAGIGRDFCVGYREWLQGISHRIQFWKGFGIIGGRNKFEQTHERILKVHMLYTM